jgi:hypothetical protein
MAHGKGRAGCSHPHESENQNQSEPDCDRFFHEVDPEACCVCCDLLVKLRASLARALFPRGADILSHAVKRAETKSRGRVTCVLQSFDAVMVTSGYSDVL